jgi:UDP-N-acetyl-D-glucosamine/UDP-N-acetyl-D-galactosamine dehydrogenase
MPRAQAETDIHAKVSASPRSGKAPNSKTMIPSRHRLNDKRIAVIGLGYVGLPVAVGFANKHDVVGFDINASRIEALRAGRDSTLEVPDEEIRAAKHLHFTCELSDLTKCNVFIVTVPTSVDAHKRPDLTHLIKASHSVGKLLKVGDIVIYESTVYPGSTEENCVPILEKVSDLTFNEHFFVGYSPERINPGDKLHRIASIKKVTSGSTPEIADVVDGLYAEIVTAGTHKAPSIRVAEAAKVIENTQRDLNIALINELAIIFNRMGIDTEEVLLAAGTKWNFLPFRPGLVGGHCIGVDPYYLTHKAEAIGYHPEIILAGRRLNDRMGVYVVSQLIKAMLNRRIQVDGAKVLVMGLTFKENCPDMRNSRVVDIVKELSDFNVSVDVFDPWASDEEAQHEYGLSLVEKPAMGAYDGIILAVAHDQFRVMGADRIRALGKKGAVVYDLKYILRRHEADLRL